MNNHDLILGLCECATEEHWSAMLFAISAKLGFKYVFYSLVPDKSYPMEKAFLKCNFPAPWLKAYVDKQFHKAELILDHCLSSSLPIVWSRETFKQPEQKILYENACAYGLRSGISYPIHGSKGEFGILSMATEEAIDATLPPDVSQQLAALALIRDYVFESSKKFFQIRNDELAPVNLTHREFECLSWVMAGKSSWEISRIKNCSVATINFHIANIKNKFQVRTRQQAVVQAIKYGLLAPA